MDRRNRSGARGRRTSSREHDGDEYGDENGKGRKPALTQTRRASSSGGRRHRHDDHSNDDDRQVIRGRTLDNDNNKNRQYDDDDESEGDSEGEDLGNAHGFAPAAQGRSLQNAASLGYSATAGGGAGPSYLPTAYGGASGSVPPDLLGAGASRQDRSIDRIRARSRDRRRDISKERSRRDRSRSVSQSRRRDGSSTTPNGSSQTQQQERATERRRNRRATLEQSLGMMSMDGSANDDEHSLFSTATDATQGSKVAMSVNGMDHSCFRGSTNSHMDESISRRSGRDSTSTDYATDRHRKEGSAGGSAGVSGTKPQHKNWEGRLDSVLSRRRRGGADSSGTCSVGTANGNGLSQIAKEKRNTRRQRSMG